MKVRFFSPDRRISFNGVISLLVNGLEGELMVLAHHSPYLIYLLPGIVIVEMNNQRQEKIAIDNGILEVADNNCNIITNQVQIFDHTIHDEGLFKNKRIDMQLNYSNQ